jgi:hypothetical protein
MIFDAHVERRTSLIPHLGIPRWHKRISYYIYKINFLQVIAKKLSRLPGSKIRIFLTSYRTNEYEVYIK